MATGSQGVRPEKQRPKPNAGPEQRPRPNAGPKQRPRPNAGPEQRPKPNAGPEQRPKSNAGPEQRPKLNAGPDTEAKTVHLRSVESGKEGGDDMGAPSAGLEVMESSGGYGNLRFDRLTPSNLEEEEKMM